MTSLATTPTTDIQPIRPSTVSAKLAMALVLAALADWLFYGQRAGLSLVVFAVAIVCASLLANHASLDIRRAAIGAAVIILGLVPVIEELNTLSFLILIIALVIALLLATNPETTGLADRARALRNFVLFGPFRVFPDALQVFNMLYKGIQEGLGDLNRQVLVDIAFDINDEHLDGHVSILKRAGADIFVFLGVPSTASKVIKLAASLNWRPVFIVNDASASIANAMAPAGLENSSGVISAAFLKDPSDPAWKDDAGMFSSTGAPRGNSATPTDVRV